MSNNEQGLVVQNDSAPQPVLITSMNALKKYNHEDVKKNDIWMVAPHLISIEPNYNARKKYDSKKQLKHIKSLRNQWNTDPAQIPPLRVVVKDGKVYVRDGHCRFIALMQAIEEDGLEIKHVTCIQFHGNDVAQLMLLLTSQDGLALDYVEQADVYSRLLTLGVTEEELAKKRDSSVQHIRNISSIASLPYRLQEYISNEVIPYTNALEVVRIYGETQAMALIDGIVERKTAEINALLAAPVEETDQPASLNTEVAAVVKDANAQNDEPVVKVTRRDLNKAMQRSNVRFTAKLKENSVSVITQLASLLEDSSESQTITLTPELVAEFKKLKESFTPKLEEPSEADGDGSSDE